MLATSMDGFNDDDGKIKRLQIHFSVLAYVHVYYWWMLSILPFPRVAQFSRKALRLLISYRVHGAHTLLIDVISYSNNDVALFTPHEHIVWTECLCVLVSVFDCIFLPSSASNWMRCVYGSSYSSAIHQNCAVNGGIKKTSWKDLNGNNFSTAEQSMQHS